MNCCDLRTETGTCKTYSRERGSHGGICGCMHRGVGLYTVGYVGFDIERLHFLCFAANGIFIRLSVVISSGQSVSNAI